LYVSSQRAWLSGYGCGVIQEVCKAISSSWERRHYCYCVHLSLSQLLKSSNI
jgi:hypothetical protein